MDSSDTSGRLAITPFLTYLETLLDQMDFAQEALTQTIAQVSSDTNDTLQLAEDFSDHSFQSVWQLNEHSFPYLSDLPVLSSSAESMYSCASHSSSLPELHFSYDADLEDSGPDSA